MVQFTELLVYDGVGPFHMNRTRTIIKPRAGMRLPNGYDLYNALPKVMDARTAACTKDEGMRWNNEATLWFRGKPRIRPFILLPNITIPAGIGGISIPIVVPIPESVQRWELPAVHTDHVGFAAKAREHAVTVQTLERHFATSDDNAIQGSIESAVVKLLIPALAPVAPLLIPLLAMPRVRSAVAAPLVDHVLSINRKHFLAGRRSFTMGPGSDGNWIFETAALERYSCWQYEKATDYVMGGANTAVKPVWVQMGQKIAATYGTLVGSVEHKSDEGNSAGEAGAKPIWREITSRHSDLDPRG